MTKQEKMEQVKIYREFLNYRGEVTDSIEIATFRNISWASQMFRYLLESIQTEVWADRYKICLGDGKVAYITKECENEFAKSCI